MVRRHGWMLFVVVAVAGLVPALILWFAPGMAPTVFASTGHEVPDPVANSEFFPFLVRWIASVLLGGNLITLILAPTLLKHGERWVWAAMWYWPLMFASHVALYQGSQRISQVVWTALTTGALVAMRPGRAPAARADAQAALRT